MRILIRIIPIVLLVQSFDTVAQNNMLKKANRSYQKYEYAEAIKAYERALEKGYDSPEIYQKLGDSYYFNSYLEDAARWYEILFNTKDTIAPIYYFRAAHAFKYLGEYEKAHKVLNQLAKINDDNPYVARFLNDSKYLDKITKQAGRYAIKHLSVNSKNSDFAPSFYKDHLVFSSSRENGNPTDQKNLWTAQPYFSIYQGIIQKTGEVTSPSKFSNKFDYKFHESTTTFTKYGTSIYFTRTNIVNSEMQKDSLHINGLKIYKAFLGYKNQWMDAEELPFNSDSYSVAHPALSPDNKKLYFVSNMPGGYGMSDIYVVDILEDESFGEPVNLGPEINTEGRDTFPFVSKTGKLYFASNGHLGLGGLDIFVTDLTDATKKVYNVGEPINSEADDITFVIDDTTKKGYFASNRKGGKGSDDIYSLEELKPIIEECSGTIEIVVKDQQTEQPIEEAKVVIHSKEKAFAYSGSTNKEGMVFLPLDCDIDSCTITVEKNTFDSEEKMVSIQHKDSMYRENFFLRSTIPASKGTDIGVLLSLNPIYFQTAKSTITQTAKSELDKIVAYLEDYPSVKIEIRSHTDSRGKDGYNLWLSNERALSTANYLMQNGISTSRIKSKGFGEKELKNECSNGVKCSKEKHLVNRRSEFVVVEN